MMIQPTSLKPAIPEKESSRFLREGFSLVDVLIAIGVAALILGAVMPAIQHSRERARKVACQAKLKWLGLAMQNYVSHSNCFPPGGVHMTTSRPGTVPVGNELTDGRAPWTVLILPQLGESKLYNRFNFGAPFFCQDNKDTSTPDCNRYAQRDRVYAYSCPTVPNQSFAGTYSSYAASQGGGTPGDAAQTTDGKYPRLFFDNGIFFHNSSVTLADVSDGLSNTVLIGETKYIATSSSFDQTRTSWRWSSSIRGALAAPLLNAALFNISATVDPMNQPQNGEYTEADILKHKAVFEGCGHGGQQRVFGSWHSGGANFAMCDGSIHFLNQNMDLTLYRALGPRNDSERLHHGDK